MQPVNSKSTLPFLLLCLFAAVIAACKPKEQPAAGDSISSVETPASIPFVPLQTDSISIVTFLESFPLFSYHKGDILAFYRKHDYAFGWFDSTGIKQAATNFVNILNALGNEGLRDTVIYISDLNSAMRAFITSGKPFGGRNSTTEQIEMLLTAEFFVYAQKIWGGISETESRKLSWYVRRKTIASDALLDSVLQGSSAAFVSFQPRYKQYELLKEQLKFYKELAQTSTWTPLQLPKDKKYIAAGDSLPVVVAIKNRLFLLGDLQVADSSALFDSLTTLAVKRFQRRFGLTADGRAGQKFLDALNTPPDYRIAQIEINMERCRWIPTDYHGDYVVVNIPEFKAHIYSADTLSWNMQVIVGSTSTSTTIFNDEIEYIVFSPFWKVPGSIIRNEIFPALVKDAQYLVRNHMELYNYSNNKSVDFNTIDMSRFTAQNFPFGVRQKPGAHNSLGWAKFIFPNAYDIYLHDTPNRNLFAETQRNFSHGCIRISEPQRFAEFLLRNDSTWTKSAIDSVMHGGIETKVVLEKPVPVMIVYFTAWVDADGILNFRKDIYGHDAGMMRSYNPTKQVSKPADRPVTAQAPE